MTTTGFTDSRPALPDLPAGLRWLIEKDVYSRLVISLQQQKLTIFGNKRWKIVSSRPLWTSTLETSQIKPAVEALAQDIWTMYDKGAARERVKDSLLGVYGKEAQ